MVENKEVKDMNVKDIKVENVAPKSKKPTEKEMKWEADRDLEIVTGVFKFHENPGEVMKFYFRGHPGQEIEKYELKDGEVVKIPLCVARHLNKNCWVPVDQYALDKNGLPTTEVGKKVRRCSFYALNYVDMDDLSEVGSPYVPPTR